jgi:dGTPase
VDAAFAAVDRASPGLPFRLRVNQAFIRLLNEAVTDLVASTSARVEALGLRSVEDVRRCGEEIVGFSPPGAERQEAMHALLMERFYRHWKVARMQESAKRCLTTVFEHLVERPRVLPPEVQEAAEAESVHVAVKDHVASMTDRELQQEYRRIVLP